MTLSADCASNNIANSVWGSISFNVNGYILYPAIYNPATSTITFQNSYMIDVNNVLEELFHAFQNTVYSGGIAQYSLGTPGFTNIEFEAKLFKDIYSILYGGMTSGNLGFPDLLFIEYNNWVTAIASGGFTPALLEQYITMLGYFNQYNVGYGGYLLPELNIPQAIIQAYTGCN